MGAEGLKRIGLRPLYLPARLSLSRQPESAIQPTWPVVPAPGAHVVPLATPEAVTSCLQRWLLPIPPRQKAGRMLYPSLGALGSEGVSEGPGLGEFHQPQERLQESCSRLTLTSPFSLFARWGAALLPSPFQKADSSAHLMTRDKCHPQLLK